MKKIRLIVPVLAMTLGMGITAYAGQWQSDANGWWWQEDDGSYPANTWKWIDGNNDGVAEFYYFDGNGYMLSNGTAPNGSQVNAEGQWVVNGVVQTQGVAVSDSGSGHKIANVTYTANSITNALAIQDWTYYSYGSTTHFLEITNNSPYTLNININDVAKNMAGVPIGAGSTSEEDIPAGSTVLLSCYLSDVNGATGFDTSVEVTQSGNSYVPVLQNIAMETSDLGDKVLVTLKNNGGYPVEFAMVTALFFNGDNVVDYDWTYFTDSDSELKPGASMTKQLDYYNLDDIGYNAVKVYVSGSYYDWNL